ncbi:HNH endonuclease signature motif containing protein [Paenibacillus macerans]|uniref:HNH endonuclease signature motif containing protein n=1 Tax=Paenibacillus macerans TaxID=44252 RepID=UPI003D321658
MALKKFCRFPGCKTITDGPYCSVHANAKADADRQRGTSAQRGYDHNWRAERADFLAKNPVCKTCLDAGKLSAATVVDHIVPHKGNKELFWDRSNWQPLCASCHSEKTAREDGGFGNGRR